MNDSIFKSPGRIVNPYHTPDQVPLKLRSLHIDFAQLQNDLVRLESVQGMEAISQPFEFNLELRVNDSDNQPIDGHLLFSNVIGNSATIFLDKYIQTSPGQYTFNPDPVFFNGIITSFGKSDPGVYTATLRPKLWKLTLANNYKLHNDEIRNIREMVEHILKKHNIDYDIGRVNGPIACKRKQDWFQSGETDFQFISHLMQKAGIYYYFTQYQKGNEFHHKMILADDPKGYKPQSGNPREVRCTFTEEDNLEFDDHIHTFNYEENLTPSRVKTLMMAPISAWDTSSGQPVSTVHSEQKEIKENRPHADNLDFLQLLMMQYGINVDEAEWHRDKALSNIMFTSCKYSGMSTCRWFSPGIKFQAVDNLHKELNREYVLTSVSHSVSVDNLYSNQFQASIPDYWAVEFSIEDTFPGTVLATVVTSPSTIVNKGILKDEKCIEDVDYIHLEEYDPDTKTLEGPTGNTVRKGIYVRFPWEKKGTAQWVQLSQSMQFVPEENSTVLVARSSDDTELPEVVGSVRADGSYTVTPDNDTFNTSIGNTHSYRIGENQSASEGSDYSKNCGSSSRVSQGNNISLSIGNSAKGSKDFDNGMTPPASADVPLSVPTETTKLGNMPKWSDAYDSVNVNYGNSYSYSDSMGRESFNKSIGDSTNVQQGDSTNVSVAKRIGSTGAAFGIAEGQKGAYDDVQVNFGNSYSYLDQKGEDNYSEVHGNSKSLQYGDNTSTQHGDNTNTQYGDNTSTQHGNTSNTQYGNTKNIQIGGMSNSIEIVGMTNSLQIGGMTTSLQLVGMITNIKIGVLETNISLVPIQLNANVGLILNLEGTATLTLGTGLNFSEHLFDIEDKSIKSIFSDLFSVMGGSSGEAGEVAAEAAPEAAAGVGAVAAA